MRRIRHLFLAVLAVCLLGGPLTGATGAGAQSVESKRAEAEGIADELEHLRIEASQRDEQYARALVELEETQQSIIDTEARVAELEAEFDRHQAEVRSYAVQAYVGGEGTASLDTYLGSGEPNEVGTRVTYLKVASGDRQDLLETLAGAQVELDAELSNLSEAEADAQRLSDEARTARDAAQGAVDQESAVLDQVQGELADLVAAEEARRAEAARERAEEQARRAAEAARQAPPPAAPENPPPPAASIQDPDGPDTTVPDLPGDDIAPPTQGGPPAGAAAAVALAHSLIGIPYVWAGSSPSTGFDCSGFTSYVWGQSGYSLPHSAAAQAAMTVPVPYSELQPGDLVFYGWGYIHHVALYVGGGMIVHAPGKGKFVRMDSLYYWDQMHGAGRLP